jgi:hypothetical protein
MPWCAAASCPYGLVAFETGEGGLLTIAARSLATEMGLGKLRTHSECLHTDRVPMIVRDPRTQCVILSGGTVRAHKMSTILHHLLRLTKKLRTHSACVPL